MHKLKPVKQKLWKLVQVEELEVKRNGDFGMDNVSIKRTSILKDEKDILDVKKDLEKIKNAYNMGTEGEKKKVIDEIYDSYYWMNGAIALLPSTGTKSKDQMTETDCQYILEVQHSFLELYSQGKEINFIQKEIRNF